MTHATTEPIGLDWPSEHHEPAQFGAPTAAELSHRLATVEVADIEPDIRPFLAAAAAELALVVGIPWRFDADDPPVALLRMIARAAARWPYAGGPHVARLVDRLR